jgi:2-amino-4-hydroxy-6-hydroxymethyldihydropteridine diphosphokinase
VIVIGIGANLPSPRFDTPRETCEAALAALTEAGVEVLRRSRWYRSAPVPPSDQPWFVNGVAIVETSLDPSALLTLLHRIEAAFGRTRRVRDEARVIDLDLLAYHDRVSEAGETPVLPHPRLAERPFVVQPLAEIAPDWRHPGDGRTARELLAALPKDGRAEPME